MKKNIYCVSIIIIISIIAFFYFWQQSEKPITEVAKEINCLKDQREIDFCAEIYAPVCASVQVQCVKAPCYPVKQTFGNSCEACRNHLVNSYTEGMCER